MFVFAQISDPHLAPVPIPRPWQLLNKRLTSYFSWLTKNRYVHHPELLQATLADVARQKPQHILVTGDLINIGLPQEFEAARRWLLEIGSPENVTVIPGNHDILVPIAWNDSLRAWAEFMSGSDQPGAAERPAQSDADFPFVRRRGDIAFIGLNSALPMPISGKPAAGKLGAEQIIRLKTKLKELQAEGLFRIVLIHHAPYADLSERRALLDHWEFAEAIQEAGTELVLHGHLHRTDFEEMQSPDGVTPVIGIPSASAEPVKSRPPARYNLYRLSRNKSRWHLDIEVRERLPDYSGFRVERRFAVMLRQNGMEAGRFKQAADDARET